MSFENPIVGGENGELIRPSIQSPDYVPGVSGWTINRDGSAEFNNVVIRLDLETGSITVGADDEPQVVIRISPAGAGLIEFPTNQAYEHTAPTISGQYNATDERIFLKIRSGYTTDSGGDPTADATLTLSSADDGADTGNYFDVTVVSNTFFGQANIDSVSTYLYHDVAIVFDGAPVRTSHEVYVADDNISGNYPYRIVSGRVNNGSNTTTLVAATDTEITNTASTNTYLENATAYRVDIQVQTRSSVGTSAVGTQRIDWKLWDGAVGGTQLGATVEQYTGSVGNNLDTTTFSFLFEYAGTTGSKTLRLSGNDAAGADTLQVVSNTRFFMLVNRAGDPANILNL